MARKIRIGNPRLLGSEKTFLNEDYTSGVNLTVISNLGFALNDIAIVGEVGEEKTEGEKISSISDNSTIVLNSALKFSHNKTLAVYKSSYDQISIERAVTSVGSFSEIALIDIQWDKFESIYIDENGSNLHSYRFRFYNQYSSTYSEYSPTITGIGFTRKSVGRMIINVRRKIKDPDKNRFADSEIIEKLQDGQTDVQTNIPKLHFLKVDTYRNNDGITTVAGDDEYSLDQYEDFNYLDKIKYKFVVGETARMYDLNVLPDIEFDQFIFDLNNRTSTDRILRAKLIPADSNSSNGYFQVDPVPESASCTFYPIYFSIFPELTQISDETKIPFPEILEDYAAWKLSELMGDYEKAKQYRSLYVGPDDEANADALTGLAKLRKHNEGLKRQKGYGRSLMRFRGRNPNNYYSENGDVESRDYRREWFSD